MVLQELLSFPNLTDLLAILLLNIIYPVLIIVFHNRTCEFEKCISYIKSVEIVVECVFLEYDSVEGIITMLYELLYSTLV